ncbi:MAG: hypothetical protein M0Z82_13100, partial [Actinomycetota bacterium]|nr:hypothetical protein [Actinomycetota bacterium]
PPSSASRPTTYPDRLSRIGPEGTIPGTKDQLAKRSNHILRQPAEPIIGNSLSAGRLTDIS